MKLGSTDIHWQEVQSTEIHWKWLLISSVAPRQEIPLQSLAAALISYRAQLRPGAGEQYLVRYLHPQHWHYFSCDTGGHPRSWQYIHKILNLCSHHRAIKCLYLSTPRYLAKCYVSCCPQCPRRRRVAALRGPKSMTRQHPSKLFISSAI